MKINLMLVSIFGFFKSILMISVFSFSMAMISAVLLKYKNLETSFKKIKRKTTLKILIVLIQFKPFSRNVI